MPGYAIRKIEHAIGGHGCRLRVPGDHRPSADPGLPPRPDRMPDDRPGRPA